MPSHFGMKTPAGVRSDGVVWFSLQTFYEQTRPSNLVINIVIGIDTHNNPNSRNMRRASKGNGKKNGTGPLNSFITLHVYHWIEIHRLKCLNCVESDNKKKLFFQHVIALIAEHDIESIFFLCRIDSAVVTTLDNWILLKKVGQIIMYWSVTYRSKKF